MQLRKVLEHYGSKNKVASPYHPQTNDQTKVSNREIKRILEKSMRSSRKDWAMKLDDALWAYWIAYKAPIRCTPFELVYGNSCHLPVELEHKAHWISRKLNFDSQMAGEKRKLQLHEVEKMRLKAYKSSRIYKDKMKLYRDTKIVKRNFKLGQFMFLFNSRLKPFLGKLKSKWSGPFRIKEVKPHGAIEIEDPTKNESIVVNGQRLKPYLDGDVKRVTTTISLKEP
jgi:hypothetical protein